MKPFYRWSEGSGLMLVVRESAVEFRHKNGMTVLDPLETPMRSVAFDVDGKTYHVAEASLPSLSARAEAPLSGLRMLNVCTREGVVCTGDHLCRCCAAYSSSGMYPDKGPGHQRLMSVAEFFALQNVRVALTQALQPRQHRGAA